MQRNTWKFDRIYEAAVWTGVGVAGKGRGGGIRHVSDKTPEGRSIPTEVKNLWNSVSRFPVSREFSAGRRNRRRARRKMPKRLPPGPNHKFPRQVSPHTMSAPTLHRGILPAMGSLTPPPSRQNPKEDFPVEVSRKLNVATQPEKSHLAGDRKDGHGGGEGRKFIPRRH